MGFEKAKNNNLKLLVDSELLRQTYEPSKLPVEVEVINLRVFTDDYGGFFRENFRTDKNGNVIALKEKGVDFVVRQSNTSVVTPGAKRFWHIHPDTSGRPGQNELWTVSSPLLVGLVDLRKRSKTHGVKSKIVLTPERALYIPSGVAHGFVNPTVDNVTLIYFADRHFSVGKDTQEYRISPDDMSSDFVLPEEM